jgi:crotonobetainyl-CoA:carnitine CoA-transferase CaiB-like acyl-CoA transferase
MDAAAPEMLTDLLVVDLSRVLAGPYCTMMLADMGAEVAKIEVPGRGDDTRQWGPPFLNGEAAYYLSVNRGKKSVTLDLKTEQGREILRVRAGPINTIEQVFADPQVLARDMLVHLLHPTAGSVPTAGSPLKLSRTPVRLTAAPPLLGQHTAEVLTTYLGYTKDEIARLYKEGVL